MREVVESVAFRLSEALGDQLVAVYLYGSVAQGFHQAGDSDVNLLAVVTDETSLHTVRQAFLPLWRKHGQSLRRAPLVASQSAFARHLKLNPLFAQHLIHASRKLLGSSILPLEPPPPDPREAFAQLAADTMRASAALAPSLLEPDVAQQRHAQLRRLVRRVTGESRPPDEPAAQMMGIMHQHLAEAQKQTAAVEPWVSPKRPSTSLLLPRLEGAYKELGQLLMSFSVLSPKQVTDTDWQHLSKQLSSHYTGLKIATSTQLRLIVELETPVSLAFQRFVHEWGADVLTGIEVSQPNVMRNAARVPSQILLDDFPNAYLTQDDDKQGKLIHDFQNRMLNIQLEHELLRRIRQIDKFTPPEALPERKAPTSERIDAILNHLNWWTDYYTEQMGVHG